MRPKLSLPLLTAVAVLAGSSGAEAAGRPCGWNLQVSGDQANVLFPDDAATYWTARVPIPAGAHVELRGRFPYARYTSLTTYTGQFQAIDGINDTVIRPDPRSRNPFLPGADRTAASRRYTVRIVNARIPTEGRAPNTLYTENADGSKSTKAQSTAGFVLRIYEGDRGRGRSGGVPLPAITLVLGTGQRIPLPDCPDTNLPDLGAAQTTAAAGVHTPLQPRLGLGGTNPPSWHRYTNMVSGVVAAALDNGVTGAAYRPVVTQTDAALPSGGFAENPDNKYVTTTFTRDYGAVLVFRGKAPTTPRTREGQPVMGTGQLRYWSMCTNSQTTAFYGCRQDDQVPLDAKRRYRIVISTAAARPENAREACGMAWLPAGPVPQSLVILRNMLPDPGFAQAIQRVEPGREAQGMGDHYPRGTYYATTEDAEALGCPAA